MILDSSAVLAILSDEPERTPMIEALASGSPVQMSAAAYRDYGRGSSSPARLNYGDCFSYALATERGDVLLFKGNDFVHTDVRQAMDEPT